MNVLDGEIIQLGLLAYTPNGASEVDLTIYTQEASLKISRRELDATRMGHTAMARKKGLREWAITGTFLMNYGSTPGGIDIDKVLYQELDADTTSGVVRSRIFNAARNPANPEYNGPATLFTHQPYGGKTGDLLVSPFEFKSSGNLNRLGSSSS